MPKQKKKVRREPVERAVQYISSILKQFETGKPMDPDVLSTFVVAPLRKVEGILDDELHRD